MRRVIPFVLAVVVGVLLHLAAGASRTVAAPASAGSAAIHQSDSGPPRDSLQPTLFGKWWKKFKKVMQRLLDFIDGLIDDLRGQPNEGGGSGKGIGALAPHGLTPAGAPGSGPGPPVTREAGVA